MTVKSETETVETDNGTPPETGDPAGTGDNDTPPETGDDDDTPPAPTEEEGRLKFLRGKLDEATAELVKLRKAEEERARAEMSETERARADAEKAAAENLTLRRELVALRHGLDPEIAERLRGDTAEELEADAKALAEKFGSKAKKPAPPASSAGVGIAGGDETPLDPLEAHRKFTGQTV